jgi:hypothetical protein
VTTKDCLELLLGPLGESFSVEFARKLAELRAAPEVQQRIDSLAEKANEGALTPDGQSDYKSLIDTSTVLAIMQLKGRQFLAQHSTLTWMGRHGMSSVGPQADGDS